MPRRTGIGSTAMVVIAVIVIAIGTVGFVVLTSQQGASSTSSSAPSQDATTASTSGANTTTICSITGEPFGVVLRVVSDSGSPISGAEVTGESVAYCGNQQQTNQLPSSTTNSSGWVSFLDGYPGNYRITLSYSGQRYNVTVPTTATDATYATYAIPSGNLTTSYCFANRNCLGSTTQTAQSGIQTNAGFAFSTEAVLVTHFCTNTTALPTNEAATAASNLRFSGGAINGSSLIESVTNDGTSPVMVQAVCIQGAGIDANSTSLGLNMSPDNPIQPGQTGTVIARFNEGTTVYALPLRSIEFTLIAGDGSRASDNIPVCCGAITEPSQSPLISIIQNMTLQSRSYLGAYPQLSAPLNFNGSVPAMTLEVDINGTYVGTVSISTNYVHFNALFTIGIIDPGLSIQAGARYSVTLLATYQGWTTSSATATVLAT